MSKRKAYGFGIVGLLLLFLASSLSIASKQSRSVRIRSGDTVSYLTFKYLKAYNETIAKEILQLNPNIKDLNLIRAGDVLILPKREIIEKPAQPSFIETKTRGDEAVITFLQGKGQVLRKGSEQWEEAQVNMILHTGDQVKILPLSKMELILDNCSVIRLTENTLLHLEKMERQEKRSLKRFTLSIGRLWTKVTRLISSSSSYNIHTPTAISAVYGTTYDLLVDGQGTTQLRVFEGRVGVYNPFVTRTPGTEESPEFFGVPREVPGPQPVPGPHEVSREEWTRIIVSQYQMVTLSKTTSPKTFSFTPKEAANENWVRWNIERDRDIENTDLQSIPAPVIFNDHHDE